MKNKTKTSKQANKQKQQMKAICNKCLTVVYVYTSYHIRVYTSKTLNVCYFFFNRTGKKFYCNKCKTTVIGYNEYRSHREAHLRIRNSTEEPVRI